MLWAGSALLAWALLVAGWFIAEIQLARIADRVTTDMRAQSEARELESAILAHRREDRLWETTGLDYHRQRGREHLQAAERIAASMDPYVTTPHEQELLRQIQQKLMPLREEWMPRPAGITEAEVQETEARVVDDLLMVVDRFQAQNESQMEESIRAAAHLHRVITYWTLGLSLGTAALLLTGALSLVRRVIHPTLALTEAAGAFGQGDFSAKAPILHGDELGALARTFNNMARDIADREKDRLQFVAMVVHDLKNPVLAIEMGTRTLQGADVTDEQRRSYLESIRQEAARIRRIIRDLTDDVQVAEGRFSVQKTEVDLGMLVQRFVESSRETFATHEILVRTDQGCLVPGDADRIERVLMNLVSNAAKYSPPGTPVRLEVRNEDSWAVLTVSDQGQGIPQEDLKVLFQPFGRGRSAHTLAEGTGMGLYVVQQIVEAHDGQIDVQSEPGHGATFQIKLPRASDKAPLALAGSGRHGNRQGA
jgi:signal transduction histidine kinase